MERLATVYRKKTIGYLKQFLSESENSVFVVTEEDEILMIGAWESTGYKNNIVYWSHTVSSSLIVKNEASTRQH